MVGAAAHPSMGADLRRRFTELAGGVGGQPCGLPDYRQACT
jgi:hypothetical protein